MNILERILKARANLILDHAFFGVLALRLKLVEDESFPTAAVDGEHLFYNPKFIDKLSNQELIGLMAHEVMHIALGHIWRAEHRESKRWNVAGDYAINENLVAAGFTLPAGGLIDPQYNERATEEIYNMLPEMPNSDGNGDGNGDGDGKSENDKQDPGGCGGVIPTKDKAKAKELKATWKAAVAQAVTMDKGELPANMKRQINDMLNPAVPWYVLLRDFVEKTARNDYDWTRPNKHYLSRGFILPSLVSEELPEIVIAVDTSGSIDEEALNHFATEASSVLSAYDTTIRVIYCDTEVTGEQTFSRADLPMEMKPVGGGGTMFEPVFDHVHERGYTPACLIYFTDMYGSFPDKEPDYPVMWLTMTKDVQAPWGQTVFFNKN